MPQLNIEQLLAPVRRHLQGVGIQPQLERNVPASESELSVAEQAIGAALPHEFRGVYREYANGFRFRWALNDDFGDAEERGCLELPDLTSFSVGSHPRLNSVAPPGQVNAQHQNMRATMPCSPGAVT